VKHEYESEMDDFIISHPGAMIVSGCALSKDAMMAYNEARIRPESYCCGREEVCACQYATAEAALALQSNETKELSPEGHSAQFLDECEDG